MLGVRGGFVAGGVLRVGAEDGLLPAVILDFRARLANRCMLFPVSALFRASILDFKARLANRCILLPVYALQRASILDFRPRLANRCNTIVVAVENGPPAMAVAATTFRVRFYSSLPHRRMARLQRPSPQRPYASDSNFRSCKGEWPACSGRRRNGLPHPILFFVVAKENSFACSGRCGNDLPHPNNSLKP